MKEQILAEFRAAYREAYKGILSPSVLEGGNAWFENFLTEALQRVENDCEVRAAIECMEHEKVAEKRGREKAVDYLIEQARYYNLSIQAEFMAKEGPNARTPEP